MKWLSRALVMVFCVMSALYAFLASSSFTYQQFLRPRVVEWVARFGDWHAVLYWPWLLIALASILAEMKKAGAIRVLAVGFAVVWTGVGLALVVHPVLPRLVDDYRSIQVGLVALAPVVWLAVIDHIAVGRFLREQPTHVGVDDVATTERRLLIAAVGAAVFVPTVYGVLTPLASRRAFEPDLLSLGLTLGLAWSYLEHLVLFCAMFLLMSLTERVVQAMADFRLRYGAESALLAATFWIGLQRLVGNALGLDTAWGSVAMLSLSVSVVSTWGALRCRQWAVGNARLISGFDVYFGPSENGRVSTSAGLLFLAIPFLAFVLAGIAAQMDWDFLILKLGVLAVWIVTFTQIYRTSSGNLRAGGRETLLVCAIPLLGYYLDPSIQARLPRWLGDQGLSVRHTLDRYVVYNPTFRLVDSAVHLGAAAETSSFNRFVRANTGLSTHDVSSVDINFVPALQASPLAQKPNVFLFVIDSLRPDYLSPYNDRVSFTPRIAEFASDSIVFRNAFTRYGGTGLSMSAMWMGAAGPHRQYVQPFRPMNALEKLLDANAYRRYVSMDHIMEQLLTPTPLLVALDRGVPELEYDFCRTLGEIEHTLQATDEPGPVFAHTRSLNLHVAALGKGTVPPGESYPGFEARYAARVHRMDACFGGFIDFLKRRGLYDRSVVILTSDHGEMLGEDRQWGHAYYLFPPVLQIPLVVHLPPAVARSAAVDVDAIAFSTDITPTMYTVLGNLPSPQTDLMGQSLIGASGADFTSRRRATEVVAASYGAVWGVLRHNGQRLYIVDANHGKDYAFERLPRQPWHAVQVNAALKVADQQAIREHIDEITREYGVTSRE
jgi:Sulfatase